MPLWRVIFYIGFGFGLVQRWRRSSFTTGDNFNRIKQARLLAINPLANTNMSNPLPLFSQLSYNLRHFDPASVNHMRITQSGQAATFQLVLQILGWSTWSLGMFSWESLGYSKRWSYWPTMALGSGHPWSSTGLPMHTQFFTRRSIAWHPGRPWRRVRPSSRPAKACPIPCFRNFIWQISHLHVLILFLE